MELDRRLAASGLDLDALDPRLRSHLELRASHPEARLGVGRYLLTDELGRGGMGVVYEGWDPVIGRRVAIKTLELHLVAEEEREEVVERFRRETRIVGKLDHPGIVTIYDSGVEQWRRESRRADEPETIFYYVMERLEGRSLSDELRERAPLDPLRAVRVARSLAEVLDRAHDEGIIHRDIKPSNVFLRDEGGAVLLDFGIATAGTGVLTQQGQILGTPSYLAPERLHEKETPIDGRADQFSLGVLLFTMLAGKPPFVGKDMYDVIDKITKDDPPALDERSPGGQSLSRIVEQLLAKDPEQRFATAGAAAEALAQVEAELSAERASPARPAPEVAARAVQPAGTPVVPSTDLSGLEGEATAIGLPPEVTQEGLTLGEEGTTGDLSTDPEVSSAGDAAPSPRDEAAPAAPGPLSLWPGDDTAAEATVADMADEATGTDSDARRGPRFEVSLVETDDVMVRPLRDSEISDEELVTQAATAVHQAGAGERPRREPEPRRPTPLHLEPETPSEPEAPQRRAREKKKSAAPRMDVRVRESSSRWRWLDDRKPLLIAGLLLSVGVGLALGRMGRRASSPEGSVADESPVAVVAAERRTSKPQHPHGRALLSDAEAARTSGELERAELERAV
ncbi:MAG: protein kinase [Myxococcota bacterium]